MIARALPAIPARQCANALRRVRRAPTAVRLASAALSMTCALLGRFPRRVLGDVLLRCCAERSGAAGLGSALSRRGAAAPRAGAGARHGGWQATPAGSDAGCRLVARVVPRGWPRPPCSVQRPALRFEAGIRWSARPSSAAQHGASVPLHAGDGWAAVFACALRSRRPASPKRRGKSWWKREEILFGFGYESSVVPPPPPPPPLPPVPHPSSRHTSCIRRPRQRTHKPYIDRNRC